MSKFNAPTPPAEHVTVPSWQVSREQLNAWGFPVRQTDKVMGAMVITQPGMDFIAARHEALLAGFTHIAIEPQAHWEAAHAAHMAQHGHPEWDDLTSDEVCAALFHRNAHQPVGASS